MRLFKTEMLFPPASRPANRPRYGGRGPRRARTLDDQPECGDSSGRPTPCVVNAMDAGSCVCRVRDAACPAGGMDRAA
jgi:hypothetical protein